MSVSVVFLFFSFFYSKCSRAFFLFGTFSSDRVCLLFFNAKKKREKKEPIDSSESIRTERNDGLFFLFLLLFLLFLLLLSLLLSLAVHRCPAPSPPPSGNDPVPAINRRKPLHTRQTGSFFFGYLAVVRRCRRSAWNHPTRVRGRCLAVVVVVVAAAAVVVAVESAAVAVSFAGSATASQRNKIDLFLKKNNQKSDLVQCKKTH